MPWTIPLQLRAPVRAHRLALLALAALLTSFGAHAQEEPAYEMRRSALGLRVTSAGFPVFAPNGLSFTGLTEGAFSAPASMVLTNAGTQTLGITSLGIQGGDGYNGFFLVSSSCGESLEPGASCQLTLRAQGQSSSRTGTLQLDATNASTRVHRIQLFSTVEAASTPAASLELSTASVDFGSVATHSSATRQVLASNSGSGVLTFSALPAVAGSSAFAAGATTCGASLAPGSDCLAEVTFSPTAAGSFNGTLTFTSTLANSPHEVTLVGSAFNPVSLSSAVLPTATKGVSYSYDFKPLLLVSNEASADKSLATWSSPALPAGLSLNPTTGVLSGTPTAMSAATGYTITGTYKNNQGQQVYLLEVAGSSTSAVQIVGAGGGGSFCVLTETGGVKCWGNNLYGQLGDGTTTNRSRPTQVVGLTSGVQRIAQGSAHVCAILKAGGVRCWGSNQYGQLGDGTTTPRSQPVAVLDLGSDVVDIRLGGGHSCALLTGNQARCWGLNAQGQLGNGTQVNKSRPGTETPWLTGILDLEAGGSNTCAVNTAGAALCWGQNNFGQLGAGAAGSAMQLTPRVVNGLTAGVAKVIPSKYYYNTCAVMQDHTAKCWGYNEYGQVGSGAVSTSENLPVDVAGLGATVAHIEIQQYHACALTLSGGVKCWGGNGTLAGRLGDGSGSAMSLTPVDPVGLTSGVASIALTRDVSCALLEGGALKCWGYNPQGLVGDGTTVNRPTPVSIGL